MHKPNNLRQYLAALVVALMGGTYGIMTGFSSPIILLLTSDHSPLPTGKISEDDASWITSLKALGALVGFAFFGIIAKRFGRKWPFIFLSIPLIVSWLLILYAQSVYYIFIARLLHGVATAGIFALAQLYFLEISTDNVRGALGSTVFVSGHIGVVLAFVFGAYATPDTTPIFGIVSAVLFAILFSMFPETPLYLVKANKLSEARRSIRFYQNIQSGHDDLVDEKIAQVRHQIDVATAKKATGNSGWSDLTKNPGRKAMIIGIALASLMHFSGSYAMISYAAIIFQGSGSIFGNNESALFIGVVQFIGTSMLPLLVERIGRKALYIVSTLGTTLGLAVLGTYILLKSLEYDVTPYNWISIVSLSFVVLVQSFAISTLPFVVAAEMLPENSRELGASICNTVLGTCSFIVLKSMLAISNLIGLHGLMFLFAGICIPYAIFIIIYMPETKGKSYEQIMNLLK